MQIVILMESGAGNLDIEKHGAAIKCVVVAVSVALLNKRIKAFCGIKIALEMGRRENLLGDRACAGCAVAVVRGKGGIGIVHTT